MAALDQNALLLEFGHLYIGDDENTAVNVGALRNLRFTGEIIQNKIDSDNRGTVVRKGRLQGKFDAELLEPGNMSVLNEIFKGLVTRTTVASSIVNNSSQVVAAGDWNYNVFIPFTNQNGDGTQPNIDSVTGGTDGALVANTDYAVVKDPATGKWGIVVVDSTDVTTENQTITIQIDYTPNASQKLTGGTSQVASPRYAKIEGPSEDDENVKRTIELDECVATSPLLLAFVNVEKSGDVGVMPLTLESNDGTEFTITDEINPS